MITPKQLAEALGGVNVEAVAKAADVSTKTIYRLRHQKHMPRLDTVTKVMGAVLKLKRQGHKAAAAATDVPAREAA